MIYKGDRKPFWTGWVNANAPHSFGKVRLALDKVEKSSASGKVRLEMVLSAFADNIKTKRESAWLHDSILKQSFWKAYILGGRFKGESEEILELLAKQADDFTVARKPAGDPATGNRGTKQRLDAKRAKAKRAKARRAKAKRAKVRRVVAPRKAFLASMLQKDYPLDHGPILQQLFAVPTSPEPTAALHGAIRAFDGDARGLHDRLMRDGQMASAIRARFPEHHDGLLDLLEAIVDGTDGIPIYGPHQLTAEEAREAAIREKALRESALREKAIRDRAIRDRAREAARLKAYPATAPIPLPKQLRHGAQQHWEELRTLQTRLQGRWANAAYSHLNPSFMEALFRGPNPGGPFKSDGEKWAFDQLIADYEDAFAKFASQVGINLMHALHWSLKSWLERYETGNGAQIVFDDVNMVEIRRARRANAPLEEKVRASLGKIPYYTEQLETRNREISSKVNAFSKLFYPDFDKDYFPKAELTRQTTVAGVRTVMVDHLKERLAAVETVLLELKRGHDQVFAFKILVEWMSKIVGGGAVCKQIAMRGTPKWEIAEVAALSLTIVAALASLGESLFISAAGATLFATASAMDAYVLSQQRSLMKAGRLVGFTDEDIHFGWVVVALVGLAGDVKAVKAVLQKARYSKAVMKLVEEQNLAGALDEMASRLETAKHRTAAAKVRECAAVERNIAARPHAREETLERLRLWKKSRPGHCR